MKGGLAAVLFLGALVAGAPGAAAEGNVASLRIEPPAVPIGGLALVRVGAVDASGTVDGRPLRFYRSEGESIAWIGVDLEASPGRHPVHVESGAGRFSGELEVKPTSFPEERLTVSKKYTDLDPRTLERVKRDQAVLEATWEGSVASRLWQGPFARPAEGPSGSPFGLRRFFNGEPRSPHAGIDIRAPKGAPVVASNRGRVALVDDLFFTGKTIALDHGLGVFTLYIHLSQTDVVMGGVVEKGERIGLVGATGRVTGPHLHFADRVAGARIDPDVLLGRALD